MSWQLETDFRYTLEKRKNFYDINFPGLRTVEDRETYQLSAKKFVNISNVRSELQYRWNEILRMSPDLKMGDVLAKLGYDSSRIDKLTEERKVKCKALGNKEITQDKLIDRDMTLAEFIAEYVPERASTSENEVQKALSSVFN
jgi:hypothetical protein